MNNLNTYNRQQNNRGFSANNNNNNRAGWPGNNSTRGNNSNLGGYSGNNNNLGGFLGNNNLHSFSGNNSSFLEQSLQNSNNWSSNSGRGDFWSTMNNGNNRQSGRLNSPPPLPSLLTNFLLNNLVGGGGGGDGGGGRGQNSGYSPSQRYQSWRPAITGRPSSSGPRGRSGFENRRVQDSRPQSQLQRSPRRSGPSQQAQSQSKSNLKRSATSVGPKNNANAKKSKTSAPAQKAALPAHTGPKFPMVIIPEDYPDQVLSREELTKLENAIIDEVAKGWDVEIEFGGKSHGSGCFYITCLNENTSKWLEERAPQLESWDGVPLKAIAKDALPKVRELTISFTRSAGQDVDKTLAIVATQNKDINTDAWKVIKHKDDEATKAQLITVVLSGESLEELEKKEHFINYRFGRFNFEPTKDGASAKQPLPDTEPTHAVVVVPEDYPTTTLPLKELIQLESLLIDEIAKGCENELLFRDKFFRGGGFHVTCRTEATLKWLTDIIPQLECWEGVPLKLCPADSLPKLRTITISFPKTKDQEVEKTIALLTAQNKDIDTTAWKVLRHKDFEDAQLVTIVIDDESLEAIKKKDNSLNYRFGHVTVETKPRFRKHKKKPEKKEQINGKGGGANVNAKKVVPNRPRNINPRRI